MRVVIQRVSQASVKVEEKIVGAIKNGLLVLLGIEDSDTIEDIEWLSAKIVNLRIFNDANGVMNISIKNIDGNKLIGYLLLNFSPVVLSTPLYVLLSARRPIS